LHSGNCPENLINGVTVGVQSLISEYEEKPQPLDGGEAAKNEFARVMLEEKKRTHRRMKIKS
jgi:hypothetical protein